MTFLSALTDTVRDAYCYATSSLENLFAHVSRVNAPVQFISSPLQGAASFANSLYCNREPSWLSLPFTGGQCNINYRVRWDYTLKQRNKFNNTILDSSGYHQADLAGAISAIYGSAFSTEVDNMFLYATYSGGTYSYVLPGNNFAYELTEFSVNSVSVTPLGGAIDNCGNPPPIQPGNPSPNYNISNNNVTFVDDNSVSVTVPVVIAFGFAYADIDGSINVPVHIDAQLDVPIGIDAAINLTTGDINFNFGGNSGGGGGSPGGADTVTPDDEVPEPPAGVPPALPVNDNPTPDEPKKVIVGVLVTVSEVPQKWGKVFQDSNPDIWVPRLGNVQFRVRVGGVEGWTDPVEVRQVRQLVECRWPEGAIECRGTPEPGVVWALNPIVTRRSLSSYYP